jgi:fermentation-respiration switch protein FrsA (DUF1100 family)
MTHHSPLTLIAVATSFQRRVLWVSGLLDICTGVGFIAFPGNLIDVLGLPIAFPSVYLAIAGAGFLGFGFTKVRQANTGGEPGPSLAGVLVSSAISVAALATWGLSGALDLPALGWVLYATASAIAVALTAAALLALRRPKP